MSIHCIQAIQLYKRDPKIKREDVRILQEWLKKQPHLPQLLESQVIVLLHSCYYNIEAAKTAIDKYLTIKTLYPDLFHCPSEDVLKNGPSTLFNKVLPKKTPQGNTIFLTGLNDYKPEKYNFVHEIALLNCLFTIHVLREGFVEGLVVVLDFKGGTLGHLARVNLSALKHALQLLQDGSPLRIKQMHMINVTPFIDKVMGLIKPLMSGKLFEMIQLHSSIDTLYQHVPKECLPEDYGGELPSCKVMTEEVVGELLENVELLKWHDSQRVDESKRMQETNNLGSSFGVAGTFKRLELD